MSLSITNISPSTLQDGDSVTLTGSGFGASQGSVVIGGVTQSVSAWSDTSITFTAARSGQSMGGCRVDVVGGVGYSHGDVVTITGSGFGTNSASLEFIGGSTGAIESTTVGQLPSKNGWTFNSQWADPLAYDDNERGRVLRALVTDTNYNGDLRFDYGSAIGTSTDYYWTWWAKADVTNLGSPAQAQWKLGRVNYVNNIQDSDCEIAFFNWDVSPHMPVRRGGGDNTTYYPSGDPFPDFNATWCRMELFVHTGTQGTADGVLHLVTHKNGARSVYTIDPIEIYNGLNRHRYFVLQNYWGNFGAGAQNDRTTWIDDVAIAVGSWKRVELADSATLSTATVREFQPWTSWGDSAVTVELNKGGRVAGTYFLHVVSGLGTSLGYREIVIV